MADLPIAPTRFRYSVQLIDERMIPLVVMDTDNPNEARKAYDEVCGHQYRRHFRFIGGPEVIDERPPLAPFGQI
ncbi:hypothetical protein [Mesorhizobium sp. STM 4661]|uniref:hypothetical protein n=1 Tax=Mesorhizobium sp. STM 4661 TaxID=1297570 RepID=UPI0012FA14F8|nr:hypothetical protein [Mesorhizobium sp. STM 4661]